MKMAVARISIGSAVPVLVVALLACVAAVVGGTACDGVNCGMGTCKEIPPLIPQSSTYECDCYPGWGRMLPVMPSLPCLMPICPSDHSCYIPTIKMPPLGSNITLHPCLLMDCGPEGRCVEGQDKPLRCQCNPGATNMLNKPSLPCIKNCVIGKDGCPVKTPPPQLSPLPSPSPSPAPTLQWP